ncbi:hypothetical protein EYC84_002402 [Monilinia fructicola]|uniref:Uncharacterized protein n=1 Tax=Monilinia fructicola TaxID=38448 RepID=A0A5M9JKN8_MONFR|nr:hypothetical protein EYC84_002402 [Monilinia fructicola]
MHGLISEYYALAGVCLSCDVCRIGFDFVNSRHYRVHPPIIMVPLPSPEERRMFIAAEVVDAEVVDAEGGQGGDEGDDDDTRPHVRLHMIYSAGPQILSLEFVIGGWAWVEEVCRPTKLSHFVLRQPSCPIQSSKISIQSKSNSPLQLDLPAISIALACYSSAFIYNKCNQPPDPKTTYMNAMLNSKIYVMTITGKKWV